MASIAKFESLALEMLRIAFPLQSILHDREPGAALFARDQREILVYVRFGACWLAPASGQAACRLAPASGQAG